MSMDIDQDKVDQAVLALLSSGRHDGYRTWLALARKVQSVLMRRKCVRRCKLILP
jgi:hypothetical protein